MIGISVVGIGECFIHSKVDLILAVNGSILASSVINVVPFFGYIECSAGNYPTGAGIFKTQLVAVTNKESTAGISEDYFLIGRHIDIPDDLLVDGRVDRRGTLLLVTHRR